jgi:hypothetical protein
MSHVTTEVKQHKTYLMTYTRLHQRPDIDQPYGCGAFKRNELHVSGRLITHSLSRELFLRL